MKLFRPFAAAFLSLCLCLLTGARAGGEAATAAGTNSSSGLRGGATTPPTKPPVLPTLYYLNAPETVRRSGVVARFTVPARSRARIFFHFKNATGAAQTFRIAVNGSAFANARWGFANDPEPGIAGSCAAEKFFAAEDRTRDPQGVSLSTRVPSGSTVSGILEGVPISPEGATVQAAMGDDRHDAGTWRVEKSRHVEIDHHLLCGLGTSTAVRVGASESSPDRVSGDYGSTVRLHITNGAATPQKVRIGISPRGGELSFVYRVNGVVRRTPVIAARADVGLLSLVLAPHATLVLETMPSGGWNYPVEVRVRARAASS